MKNKYTLNYNYGDAEITFEVDRELFTAEKANIILEFFCWDYDKQADPVEEVLKKYALECFKRSARALFDPGEFLKKEFEDLEGYCKIDGSEGLELISIEQYEFNEDNIYLQKV